LLETTDEVYTPSVAIIVSQRGQLDSGKKHDLEEVKTALAHEQDGQE
jgi:hypothetical protein